MSLREPLIFEISITEKELETVKEQVKKLNKRLKYLKELLAETDKPEEEFHV